MYLSIYQSAMPKLTSAILAISIILPIGGSIVPATAAPSQIQVAQVNNSSIALTGQRCAAKRYYSRRHRR
jgi:hypothetical protein